MFENWDVMGPSLRTADVVDPENSTEGGIAYSTGLIVSSTEITLGPRNHACISEK